MLLIDVVHEIFALEDAVSFNFALGTPHVKRRVKSCRPASAAPIAGAPQQHSLRNCVLTGSKDQNPI